MGRDDSGHPTRDVSLEKEAAKYGNAPGHGLPYVSANLPNDQELKRDPVLAACRVRPSRRTDSFPTCQFQKGC